MKKHIMITIRGLLIHVDRFSKTSNSISIYRKDKYIGHFRRGSLKCNHKFISDSENFMGDKFLVYTLKED